MKLAVLFLRLLFYHRGGVPVVGWQASLLNFGHAKIAKKTIFSKYVSVLLRWQLCGK